ncbi:MAG TPA: DNA gyrase subunit A, partial [Clostridia bacterium]|nr:DNA gyrase subunit A [Clostridia bacterium]
MSAKRNNNPDQPELPIPGASGADGGTPAPAPKPNGASAAAHTNGNGTVKGESSKPEGTQSENGEAHVQAENVAGVIPVRPFVPSKIELALHHRVNRNFLDYASYVIRDRAIPHLADGLKPVQRRILWALHQMDDGRFMKVANVTGETMKYHPHGNASIDDALVVLTNKRYLIEGQGNFGNIFTGDPAAASRYIECRLTPLAREQIFNDEITEVVPSYDGRRDEPVTLPSKLPLLLMLGTE